VRELIEAAFENRKLLGDDEHRQAVFDTVAALDRGELRVAERSGDGWRSNAWVMKAINLYFAVAEMETLEAGPFEYRDKIPRRRTSPRPGCASSRRARSATGRSSSRGWS
jgi:2,3,4,5-tetrahydropyridine-2-carboxylate N-succinyltransferase